MLPLMSNDVSVIILLPKSPQRNNSCGCTDENSTPQLSVMVPAMSSGLTIIIPDVGSNSAV